MPLVVLRQQKHMPSNPQHAQLHVHSSSPANNALAQRSVLPQPWRNAGGWGEGAAAVAAFARSRYCAMHACIADANHHRPES